MAPLTLAHVVISLIGIAAGFVVLFGMLGSNRMSGWTALFLAFTVLTSVTGYLFFPLQPLLASHYVGAISLVLLAVAIYGLYSKNLDGRWRATYVVTAVMAQYLNFFVLIIQSFMKVPALHEAAPTQTETPFVAVQAVALLFFLVTGWMAVKGFHPDGVGIGGPVPLKARSTGAGR